MKLNDLKEFKKKHNIDLFFDFEIKKLNWFNIGGKSKVFFKPKTLKELKDFLLLYNERGKIFTLGLGSNVLFHDNIFNGVVIKLGNNFSSISKLNDETIIAGSSCSQKKLSQFAENNNISGLEFMYCIPGSVGGGIRMNSGCFGTEFKDILISLQAMDTRGNMMVIPSSKIIFNYRSTELDKNLIFLSATFKGQLSQKKKISDLMLNYMKKKNNSQPSKIKTGGSTFKNPINQTKKKVWELIRESVPTDLNFGDAYISNKHSNFFINKKNATSKDMINLIKYVKKKVKYKTGINIDLEIKIIK